MTNERLEHLRAALNHYGIAVIAVEGNFVKLAGDYEIEAEPNSMFKLSHEGYIIAPFADVNDLCRFILSDSG